MALAELVEIHLNDRCILAWRRATRAWRSREHPRTSAFPMKLLKVLCVFGTRPEAVKVATLISGLRYLLTLRSWLEPCRIS